MKTKVWDLGLLEVFGILNNYFYFLYCTFILLSSPYRYVFGDDHATRYMGADDVVGGAGET